MLLAASYTTLLQSPISLGPRCSRAAYSWKAVCRLKLDATGGGQHAEHSDRDLNEIVSRALRNCEDSTSTHEFSALQPSHFGAVTLIEKADRTRT